MTINDAKLAQLLNDSNFFSLVKECSSCFTSCDRLQEDFDSFTQMPKSKTPSLFLRMICCITGILLKTIQVVLILSTNLEKNISYLHKRMLMHSLCG